MAGYTLPLSIPRQPRSPRVRPRRDFVIACGDDVTLQLTILLDDAGGAAVDVTGAVTTWKIYDAGGTAVVDVTGTVEDAGAGRIDVDIDGDDTLSIPGRYPHSLRIEFTNGMSTVVNGMIHLQPVAGAGGSGFADAMTPAEGTYGDWEVAELTAASAIITGAATIGGQLTLTSDAVDALTVRGGGVFGPSDYRNFEILPTTTADGPTGMPQVVVARRVGSDDTVGVAGNLWVSQSGWVLTDTTAPAGVRYNSLVSTSAGAGVDPGEVWGFLSVLSTQASTDSLNAVPIYGQGVRRGLPSSGVGVPILAGVLEARTLTGASSATDGRLRSLELDIFANGADDITPGPGREALTFVLDKNDTGGAAPHVTSVIGVYTSTGATCSWVLRPNLQWTEAFIDARGGTQGGSANTIWLNSGHTIALDASAATKIGSNGTTITLTGAATITGAGTTKTLNVAAGAQSMTGAYSHAASPFGMSMTLPRVDGASAPTGKRNVMSWQILNDVAGPVAQANQGPSVNAFELLMRTGISGGAVADSWKGSRTMSRITWSEDNAPYESLSGPEGGKVTPAVNVTWSTIFSKFNRGGTAPEYGRARGSNFLDYGMISHVTGSTNLTNSRLYEGSLFFQSGTSVRNAFGWALNTPLTAGAAPAEVYTAYTTGAGGKTSHSWRTVFGIGETGWGGIDPLNGTLLSFKASHAAPVPQARNGIDLQDVAFSGRAIKWLGGDISGGAHATASTGRLRLGNGYLTPTTTGLQIDAVGYRGSPAGTIMTLGGDLVNGDPVVAIRNNSIGDDDYGGTYQFYSPDYANNDFRAVKVLNPPVTNGAAPSNPIEVRLRYNSSAKIEFPVTDTATTTSHPTELTATITDYYVGRYLAYYTGAAAGEKQLITAYNATTKVLTTNAFSTVPTASVNVISNFNFAAALPTVEDTIVNSWQYTLNGGTGTVVRQTSPNSANLTGDGTNAASLDQTFAWPADTDGILYLIAAGNYRVMLGTTRGASDILDIYVEAEAPDDDGVFPFVPEEMSFFSAGTTLWLRIENTSTVTAKIRNVRCADSTSGSAILLGIRAGVEAVPLTVNHTWTQRNTLELQPGAGPATFGGTLGVAGNFAVATNKLTVNASTGATVAASTITGTAFIPSASTVPTNGLYLPAANTLGFAVNSAAEAELTATAFSPAVSDGLALGTTSKQFSDAFFAFGAKIDFDNTDVLLTHGANFLAFEGGRFLFGTTTDDGSTTVQVNGTLKATGATTLGALSATSGSFTATNTINLSGTSIATIAGTTLSMAAADATGATLLMQAIAAIPKVTFRRANNTSGSPATLASGDVIGTIEGRGHDGSAFTTSRATINLLTAEAWTGSAQGGAIEFRTTATGAITGAAVRVTIGPSGNLTLATGNLIRVASNTGTATGTTISDALQLSGDFKRLSTVASGTGVILPTGVIGMAITIVNSGANAVKVYANGSETIDGVAGSTGVTLTNPGRCLYWFSAANTWHSMMFNGLSA